MPRALTGTHAEVELNGEEGKRQEALAGEEKLSDDGRKGCSIEPQLQGKLQLERQQPNHIFLTNLVQGSSSSLSLSFSRLVQGVHQRLDPLPHALEFSCENQPLILGGLYGESGRGGLQVFIFD